MKIFSCRVIMYIDKQKKKNMYELYFHRSYYKRAVVLTFVLKLINSINIYTYNTFVYDLILTKLKQLSILFVDYIKIFFNILDAYILYIMYNY